MERSATALIDAVGREPSSTHGGSSRQRSHPNRSTESTRSMKPYPFCRPGTLLPRGRADSRLLAASGTHPATTALVLAALVMTCQCPLHAAGPAPVDLKSAARFTILAGAAITTTGGGMIYGDIGASPITGAAIHLTQPQVKGTIFAVDAAGPAGTVIDPILLTAAKGDLTTAYNEAAGRTPIPSGPLSPPN